MLGTIVLRILGVKPDEDVRWGWSWQWGPVGEGGLSKDFGHRENPGSSLEERLKGNKIKDRERREEMRTSVKKKRESDRLVTLRMAQRHWIREIFKKQNCRACCLDLRGEGKRGVKDRLPSFWPEWKTLVQDTGGGFQFRLSLRWVGYWGRNVQLEVEYKFEAQKWSWGWRLGFFNP